MRGKAKNYTVRLPDGTIGKPYCQSRKFPDGTRTEYWYAWRGPPMGPRLLGEKESPQWMQCLIAAHTIVGRSAVAGVTNIAGLCDAYQRAPEFIKLAPRTKLDYIERGIKKIERELGTLPLVLFGKGDDAEQKIRGGVMLWRDKLALVSPRDADYAMTVLNVVFNWGVKRAYVRSNPFAKTEKVYDGTRRDRNWTPAQEAAFLDQIQYAHMHLPVLLGLWTGQREGDILRLKWSAYDGKVLNVHQGKTGARVTIVLDDPEFPNPLKAALDAELARRKSTTVVPLNLADSVICVNSDDQPWRLSADFQFHGFCASMRKALHVGGIKGVAFTDLRGTFVTRARAAGVEIEDIAEITGHSRAEVNAILDKHYLKRNPETARKVIGKLAAAHHRALLKRP